MFATLGFPRSHPDYTDTIKTQEDFEKVPKTISIKLSLCICPVELANCVRVSEPQGLLA